VNNFQAVNYQNICTCKFYTN